MEEKYFRKKKKALAGFGCFLALMAVCTLVTKGIYTSGMPQVTVINPEQRTITHQITLTGRVRPRQEYGIYVQPGLRVETVYADRGNVVKEGDPLFQVRMEDLGRMIAGAEADICYRQALLEEEAGRKREEQRKRQSSLDGMREDYDSMVRELDIAVEKKELAYEAARRAREQAEEASVSVSGSDAGVLESCRLAEAQAALEVEEALIRKEEAVREWNRQYADTERENYDAAAETVSLKDGLEQSRQSLERLQKLYAGEGVVSAKESGFIVDNRLQTGEYTPDTACMLFVRREDAGIIEFILDEESLECLSAGDQVDLEYKTENGGKRRQEAVISYVDSRDGYSVAKVELPPETQLAMGQGVTLKYQFVTESYPTVISRQALMEEGAFYYVYVVEVQEGFLGTEQRIRKTFVALTDSNASLAAVESAAITPESRIVLSADRELEEGDVVRLVD